MNSQNELEDNTTDFEDSEHEFDVNSELYEESEVESTSTFVPPSRV
jgi:hypothetical protein